MHDLVERIANIMLVRKVEIVLVGSPAAGRTTRDKSLLQAPSDYFFMLQVTTCRCLLVLIVHGHWGLCPDVQGPDCDE